MSLEVDPLPQALSWMPHSIKITPTYSGIYYTSKIFCYMPLYFIHLPVLHCSNPTEADLTNSSELITYSSWNRPTHIFGCWMLQSQVPESPGTCTLPRMGPAPAWKAGSLLSPVMSDHESLQFENSASYAKRSFVLHS